MSGLLSGLLGIGSSAAQFGMNYGSALLDAKIQRGLRRTVYQDQMHSMREAGLNPILAAGATPGMGSSGSMAPSDLAGTAAEIAKVTKTSDERAAIRAQKEAAEAAARKAQADADTAEAMRDVQVAESQARARAANAAAGHSSAQAHAAYNWGRANLEAGTRYTGARTDYTDALTVGQRARNVGDQLEADYLRNPVGGGLRVLGLGAQDLGSVTGIVPRGRINPSRRETATSARTPSTSRSVPPLERGRTKAGNRSGSWIKENDGTWSRVDLRTGEVFETGLERPGHYGP